MLHLSLMHLVALTAVAVLAGIVDTLAGGGGLITVPALLLSGLPPVLALGTTKLQSCLCEGSATFIFRKKMQINFKALRTGLMFTLLGSVLGTALLQVTQVEILKKLVPFFLLAVFLMNLATKYRPARVTSVSEPTQLNRLIPLGVGIGFYNGFFGPGTGTIWAVSLQKYLKLPLQSATMLTKPLNLAGNLTALAVFFASGQINLFAGMAMGAGAILGGVVGANLVMIKDARWLKWVFNLLMGASVLGAFCSM